MPITYKIDQDSGIYHERWFGEILPLEMGQHWIALMNDPNYQDVYLCIADIREARLVFTGRELWNTVDDCFRETHGSKVIKVAVLVTNAQQEQFARKWIYIVPQSVSASIFFNEEQAQEWLKSDQ
jgi:hypothetical protein